MQKTVGDLARESNATMATWMTDREALACPYCARNDTCEKTDFTSECYFGVLETLDAPADEERDDEDEPVDDGGEGDGE